MPEDGYPTEEELKDVESWHVRSEEGCQELLEFVKDCWWMPGWGWSELDIVDDLATSFETPYHVYRISTGGWSGNESLIHSMQKNTMFWMLAWYSSRRGGHYEFRVRRDR
jgi:hypothetical protein